MNTYSDITTVYPGKTVMNVRFRETTQCQQQWG